MDTFFAVLESIIYAKSLVAAVEQRLEKGEEIRRKTTLLKFVTHICIYECIRNIFAKVKLCTLRGSGRVG